MPVFEFFWTEEVADHCSAHGIDLDDFERIVRNPLSTDISRSSGQLCAFGFDSEGNYTICVYEMLDALTVLPITAYHPEN